MHLQLNGFASLKNLPISWEGNPRNKRSQETLISRIKNHPWKREFQKETSNMPSFFVSLLPQLLLLLLMFRFVQFLKDTMMASGEQWQQQLLAGEYCNITDSIYPFQNQHITTLHQSIINWPKLLSQGSYKDRLIWGSVILYRLTKC